MLLFLALACSLMAQDVAAPANEAETTTEPADPTDPSANVEAAKSVDVQPENSDQQISQRLTEIFEATDWFASAEARVDRGVVFLSGIADTEGHRKWAAETASNTSDVVAVVNRMSVAGKPFFDLEPAFSSLRQLAREALNLLPLIIIALLVGLSSYFLALRSAGLTRRVTQNQIESTLLRQVAGNVVGVLVFLTGAYVALRVSGLTRLAMTLVGGTGLIGLALGFAFRDIAENYLASILLSLNNPFRVGDLIEMEGSTGFVRKVTTRGTILDTPEGNQIQLPNSTVYKGKILNFTATPLRRLDFSLGIGFEDSAPKAQSLIMEILQAHAAVVEEPPPLALVDSLGSATVNLKVFYWIDQSKHSPLKVGSSVIRQVKQVLTEARITMPDEAREIIFPQGVPVELPSRSDQSPATDDTEHAKERGPQDAVEPVKDEPSAEAIVTEGEGDLSNEQNDVLKAAGDGGAISDEVNLLEDAPSKST